MESASERIKRVKLQESVSEIEKMLAVLKNEQYKLLTNFMYLSIDDLDVYVDVTKEGDYVLSVKAISPRIIDIGRIIT